MQQISDLHIHSRFSRACSKNLTLSNLDGACRLKGIDILGTGDFTHPAWFKEIRSQTHEVEGSGFYSLNEAKDEKIKFILSAEVALIYKDDERVRRIHLVVHAPNIKAAEELNDFLGKKYNIRSDGRPILGIKAPEFIKLCLSVHPDFLIYPAHIWTPWFSVFGSKSGFDSFERCFKDQTDKIYAYETGLSSDPEMNWRVSALDNLTLLSNSDAHSLPNLGREANVLEMESPSYAGLHDILKNKRISDGSDPGMKYTIEFYPEEGMYHFDGHRDCGTSFDPIETKKLKGICPVCKKPLVIGVSYRVDELADRPAGFIPRRSAGFRKLIELDKIIAEALGVKSRSSVKVQEIYGKLIKSLGNELDILLNQPIEKIKFASSDMIAEAVSRVREGKLIINPGFDGSYGQIKIFNDDERPANRQKRMI